MTDDVIDWDVENMGWRRPTKEDPCVGDPQRFLDIMYDVADDDCE